MASTHPNTQRFRVVLRCEVILNANWSSNPAVPQVRQRLIQKNLLLKDSTVSELDPGFLELRNISKLEEWDERS